jgi:hypothetical protein
MRTSTVSLLAGRLGLATLTALFWAIAVSAAPVEIRFSGSVAGGSFVVPPALQSLVRPGSPVLGRFAYDTDAPDTDTAATRGLYHFRDPAYRLEVQLGQVYVATDPENPELLIQVLNNHVMPEAPRGFDRLDVISRFQTALVPSAVVPGHFQLQLVNPAGTVFRSDALPATVPALSHFAFPGQALGQVATRSGRYPGIFMTFSIDAWEAVPVAPEPATASLDERRASRIVWTEARDGMALGIIAPEDPFIFIPPRGSPAADNATVPRARWHSRAQLHVYLKNSSDQPLSWSRDPRLWEVTFDRDAGPDPNDANDVARLDSRGRWYRLAPGRQGRITLPVARAREIWTAVPAGPHTVKVHYLPRRYRTRKAGRGSPEGSSRFWSGHLQTPPVTIQVQHPRRRPDRQASESPTQR